MILPVFPVDDITLSALEHALGAVLTCDKDGNVEVVGAEFSLSKLLDFYSGYNEELVTDEGDHFEYPNPIYHYTDVIAALIAEVRRLRGESL